jgi:hypothetical protein
MATLFWVGGTAAWDGTAGLKWSLTSGGVGGLGPPTAADDVKLDSGSGVVTVTMSTTNALCRSLDCTGFTGTLAHSASISLIIGDASGGALTLASGMTYTPSGSGSAGLRFASTSTNSGTGWPVTTAGKSLGVNGSSNQFTGVGGKWVLQDAWTQAAGSSLQVLGGELNTGNQTIQAGSFLSTGTNTRVLTFGTTTITLVTTSGTPWTISGTGITPSLGSSTIVIGPTSSSTRTFAGGGQTYGTLTYTVAGSTGQLTITGANTFGTLNFSDANNARTLAFTAATTSTFTTFNVNGTSGKLMTITSATAATHTLSIASGTVTCDSCSIDHSIATGGATFNATNSTDGGNNTGWNFPAPTSGNMLLFF